VEYYSKTITANLVMHAKVLVKLKLQGDTYVSTEYSSCNRTHIAEIYSRERACIYRKRRFKFNRVCAFI